MTFIELTGTDGLGILINVSEIAAIDDYSDISENCRVVYLRDHPFFKVKETIEEIKKLLSGVTNDDKM